MINVDVETSDTTENRESHWERPYAIPDSIINIWGGMKGRIIILHPTWDSVRGQKIFKEELKTKVQEGLITLSEKEVEKFVETSPFIIERMVENDNLLYEGDIIAVDHVVSQLRYLYDPNDIRIKASSTFGSNTEELRVNSELKGLLKQRHLVFIGAPPSNLVCRIALKEAGLEWLYDEEKNEIRTDPDSDNGLRYEKKHSNEGDTIIDHGVFVKCDNPYNRSKKMYALMGIHSYGTQGAAALACNNESADELISIRESCEGLNARVNIYNLAWMKLSRKAKKDVKQVSPPNVKYFIVHPKKEDGSEWRPHKNPSSIRESQYALRYQVFRPTYFLGARPTKLLLHAFFLLLLMFSYSIILLTKSNILYYVFLVFFIFGITGTILSFFWLMTASEK